MIQQCCVHCDLTSQCDTSAFYDIYIYIYYMYICVHLASHQTSLLTVLSLLLFTVGYYVMFCESPRQNLFFCLIRMFSLLLISLLLVPINMMVPPIKECVGFLSGHLKLKVEGVFGCHICHICHISLGFPSKKARV